MIKRIAITGPESTGKSLLSERLAGYYHTTWVPEFAREYIDGLDREYNQEDILKIARGQLRNENRLLKSANQYLFCDTELIVTKIWSEVKYNKCDEWILKKIEEHKYDFYLLCYIDIPWEYDPQREHPQLREHLFDLYLQEMTERNLPFAVVSGLGEERLKNAVKIINKNFVDHPLSFL
ncbi:MAG: ATP-binding protein [Bacteroidetes bacterium]|nr:ATP-binding protein [Bacteroidota bacterium]